MEHRPVHDRARTSPAISHGQADPRAHSDSQKSAPPPKNQSAQVIQTIKSLDLILRGHASRGRASCERARNPYRVYYAWPNSIWFTEFSMHHRIQNAVKQAMRCIKDDARMGRRDQWWVVIDYNTGTILTTEDL